MPLSVRHLFQYVWPRLGFLAWAAGCGAGWAGDILRGGTAAQVRQTDPLAGANVAAQQQARANQQDALAKTAQALQAMRHLQTQARVLALGRGLPNADPNHPGQLLPQVPEGLGLGALQLQGPPVGAMDPVQTSLGGLTQVTIKQTAQQALLNWESFNVGRDTAVHFDQSGGGAKVSQWIAFNRVNDPAGRPSQILGRILGEGQVYLINQNGIVFGGASQINTRSLVASALPINENLIQRGLLNNLDSQFLFSALPMAAGSQGTPAFMPPATFLPDDRRGDITVQAGAIISTSVSADGNGGRIMLVGPNVSNGGSLVSPSGQVILAAGLQVGVAAHRSSDPSLRGLDVYVGSVGSYGGRVEHRGLIEISRGSASLAGKVIHHTGAIASSTSVSLNGRIDIGANFDAVSNIGYNPADPSSGNPFLFQSTGEVAMGAGSLLQIVPEADTAEKAVGTQLALRSQINLQGKTIYLGPEATILAPNAIVPLKAGNWFYVSSTTPPSATFIASGGQVYMDRGASINVVGSASAASPLSQVILSLVLRGAELAPAPLQREGLLRGPVVTVDLRQRGVFQGRSWVGTPLADLTGYPGLVERTVGELTAAGGSVEISAGSSVVLQPGSSINVSGGHLESAGGRVKTSRVWADGHLLDIQDATPDRVYGGLFSGTSREEHPRWGITKTYELPLAPTGEHEELAAAYGGDAGSISIAAPSQVLDGVLTGNAFPGPRQWRAAGNRRAMPADGGLTLSFSGQALVGNNPTTSFPAPPDIIFADRAQPLAGPYRLDPIGNPAWVEESRRRLVYLSPELPSSQGFGRIAIHNEGGAIVVPEGTSLEGKPGGSWDLVGAKIGVFGAIRAAGGTLAFESLNVTPYERAVLASDPLTARVPPPHPGRGVFTLGAGAQLSAAGLLVDDRSHGEVPMAKPLWLGGGSISIKAYAADLLEGSQMDVSGGFLVPPVGKRTYGDGGSISIAAGQDPGLLDLVGGTLHLGSSLLGYAGAEGGALAIRAPRIQVGGGAAPPGALGLGPEFFDRGGFSTFSLTGLGGLDSLGNTLPALTIAAGTVLQPVSRAMLALPQAPGGRLAWRPVLQPLGLRNPVNLSFAAAGVSNSFESGKLFRGDLVMGAGSMVRSDPLAKISLSGDSVEVLGSIYSSGGSIAISGARDSTGPFRNPDEALTTVFLGPRSVLATAGRTLELPDAYGRRLGSVWPGGTVLVSGNILAAGGAVMDVSGSRGWLDVPAAEARPLWRYSIPSTSGLTAPLAKLAVERLRVESGGGLISLAGGQFLFSDAVLLGRAGGLTAPGGSLEISSGRFSGLNVGADTDPNLVVRQSGTVIPLGSGLDRSAIGRPVPGMISRGYFAGDTYARGGFDALALGGKVSFEGPVSLSARASLRVADGGILAADGEVRLTAPYVALGRALEAPARPEEIRSPFGTSFAPTAGSGRLVVEARDIDLGTLSLQGIGRAQLAAHQGDIRGSGTFHLAGDLTLRAGQIYPATATPFNLIAYPSLNEGIARPGSIAVERSGARPLPLAAGGALGLYASSIRQDGVLRAPFGSIALGADGVAPTPRDLIAGDSIPFPLTESLTLGSGSITSVSAVDPQSGRGLVIPYGVSPDGLSWIDPRGVDITAGGLGEKKIALTSQNVVLAPGATVDLRGGGDLLAYRFVAGNGGLQDILGADGSLAIVPDYASGLAPLAPFNASTAATNLIAGFGPGYANSHLSAGDRIFVQGSKTLRAGFYTLLPARYALLPEGVLVTPQARPPTGTWERPDGSSLVSGYAFNGLNPSRAGSGMATQWELVSGPALQARAAYEISLSNVFLANAALRLNLPVARLPRDSGSLVIQGGQSMNLAGQVLSNSLSGGRGGWIDLASPRDFVIHRDGLGVAPYAISLSSALLGSWSAESLLIGGRRSLDGAGQTVLTASSHSVTLDNVGVPLRGADLILTSTGSLTLAPGASLVATGTLSGAPDLLVKGSGAVVRVSRDPNAAVWRRGVSNSPAALTIGAGAQLRGGSLVLDSSDAATLDPSAQLAAEAYTLNSGRISLLLEEPGPLAEAPGLVLAGASFANLQAARRLSLMSYSSLDLYGSGQMGGAALEVLSLNAGEMRGMPQLGNRIDIRAGEIRLGNASGAVSVVAPVGLEPANAMVASFHAGVIRLTEGDLAFNNLGRVAWHAAQGVSGEGTGRLGAQYDLLVEAPLVTGGAGSVRSLTAGGSLALAGQGAVAAGPRAGLGAALSISGNNVRISSAIALPSGLLDITSGVGDLAIDGALDVSSQARPFYDITRYTDAGSIRLSSSAGNVSLGAGSVVNVSGVAGGGQAGSLAIANPAGVFAFGGLMEGGAGGDGAGGTFRLDTRELARTASLSSALTTAGLVGAQSIRVRSGSVVVDGAAAARDFTLAVDSGDLVVSGSIDASGATGGAIRLVASGQVVVAQGARLSAAGEHFDHAGKGGRITLESGSQRGGVVGTGSIDLQAGALLDLSVAAAVAGGANTPGSSAWLGQFGGQLHLRAPQNGGGTDVLINPLQSSILGASSIIAEGYRLYDLTVGGGAVSAAVQNQIRGDGIAFLGAAGSASASYRAMTDRLLAPQAELDPILVLSPGAEIINRTGNLTLGTNSSTTVNDWDLSGNRFGAKSAPGVLTMRAAGDLVFNNTLSDGFTAYNPANNPPAANLRLWLGRLTAQNPLLPINAQSYSYRLAAGADQGAADFAAVGDAGGRTAGSLILGKAGTSQEAQNNAVGGGNSALTSAVIPQRWQVIRTGSGDIAIAAARHIQLLNQLATIYTAGTAVADATMGGIFDVRALAVPPSSITDLGAFPANSVPQYSMGGGNVSLAAGGNLEHLTRNGLGQLGADSQLQLPSNWISRRGTVDAATGQFAMGNRVPPEVLSTTWWVDFSTFFQGIGALGGGNVSLRAGGDISNVDAVAPTNLRVSKGTAQNPLAANQTVLELGGGDVAVRSGGNIDAGIYYVERGRGLLAAGGSIVTNSTRSVNAPLSAPEAYSAYTQLPSTLFVGRARFEVSARGDLLLGPVANPFLLPEGLANSIFYKSYFSTYGADSGVHLSSLGGDISIRTKAAPYTGGAAGTAQPLLALWIQNKLALGTNSAAFSKPWLRLNEPSAGLGRYAPSLVSLQPPSLDATAYSGDIHLAGGFTLSPSASGGLSLLAAGAIHGLQPNGQVRLDGLRATWGSATLNVSDANPLAIPGVRGPLGYTVAQAANLAAFPDFFKGIDALFRETGSSHGVLQSKQALHDPGVLHAADAVPLRLYAGSGDLSGLTLFAPKFSRIFAGRDLTDVSLYLQNAREGDISVVTSGRDIIPANASAALRVAASGAGNVLNAGLFPMAGDVQIGGPGFLEVLAGRSLDLGTVAGNADGTGVGLTSIGGARNPYLPSAGASMAVAAGLGSSTGLGGSSLDLARFIAAYVKGGSGPTYLAQLEGSPSAASFDALSEAEQNRLALEVFFLGLRDVGRGRAAEGGGSGGYAEGFSAIAALFPQGGSGDILTRGRDIRTRSGGQITLLAPGGAVSMADSILGNPLAPPGIVTESGGNISIFAHKDVRVGVGRIFTLRGGDQVIWSSTGDIAAGSAAKTVQSAPPTRVLMDPQSGAVQTDLAGLATGGGIGVLATVAGVAAGDVDLIAPVGVVDAGDAGIRSSGNLTIAATQVLNAGNIAVTGSSAGTPVAAVSVPHVGALAAAGSAGAATNQSAQAASQAAGSAAPSGPEVVPSIITVEVLGYGGGEGDPADEEEEARRRRAQEASGASPR